MKTTISIIVALVSVPALAASPFNDRFASKSPGDYVEGGFPAEKIRIASESGVNALLIDNVKIRFKTASVTPNTKYTVSFVASFAGDVESFEKNPRFAIFAQPNQQSAVLPWREIQFLDAASKPVGKSVSSCMLLRQSRRYTDVFYTPPDAVALRLTVSSGEGISLRMQQLTLTETADEGAVNVNPDFRLGPLNYSGWKTISAGGKIIKMDGKTVFDTKYGSRGTTFPLPGPGTYALSAKARSNGYNSCVKVDVFDNAGKKLMTSVLRRYDETRYFVPPPGATSASLLVYSCLLEEVRLLRIGDEHQIKAYNK